MADVVVTPVESRGDRKRFIQFAWDHYKHDPNWIPPLRDNHKQLLGYKYHPFYELADIQTFLAHRDGKLVGRIAAIVNHEHNRVHSEQRGFFGFFECIDDQTVADALFDTARNWLAERNISNMRGPVNPSMNYECGLLVDGFDTPPTFMMTYNPPYYAKLIEGYGFTKAHDLLAYMGHLDQLPKVAEKLGPLVEQARNRSGATIRHMDTSKFFEEVKLFLEMYNSAMVQTWGFVPLTYNELKIMSKGMRHLVIPEMAVAADVDGRTVGAILGLPDFNPRVKDIDGRLFPFGFIKLLRSKYKIKRVRVISINVVPEYQRWGLGLVLMAALIPRGLELGVTEAEFSWILETNDLARMGLEKGGAVLDKTFRLYDFDPDATQAETKEENA